MAHRMDGAFYVRENPTCPVILTATRENQVSSDTTGLKLYRWIAVSFFVLCFLQCALNISLRLTLYSEQRSTIEDREKLKVELEYLKREQQLLIGKMKAELQNMNSTMYSLTEERNNLKTELLILTSQQHSVIKEKEDLTVDLQNLGAQHRAVTDERDKCQAKLQTYGEGWAIASSSAYYMSPTQKSWQEGRNDCQLKNADLVVIDSREEQEFVNKFKKSVWIGLTDEEREGEWKWVDGSRVTTSYWSGQRADGRGLTFSYPRTIQEPNGGNRENCGEIMSFERVNSWNDAACSEPRHWLCERRLD